LGDKFSENVANFRYLESKKRNYIVGEIRSRF